MPGASAVELTRLAESLKAEAERQLSVDSQRSLEIADQICRLEGDDGVRALGLLARADALRELGRHGQAMEGYQTAAALYRSLGDEVGWARTRIGATLTCRQTGSHGAVLDDLDEARRILTDHALWLRLARLETAAGGLLSALGRINEGLSAHRRALDAVERVEPASELLEAEVLGNLGVAYYQVDDYERAEAFHHRAVAIFEREGQREHLARAHRNYARFAAARGHYSKALSAAVPGRRALLELGRTEGAAQLGQIGVDCLIRLNRAAEAATLAAEVAAELGSIGAHVEAAVTHGLRSLALAHLGDGEAALGELTRAEALFGTVEWEAGQASVRLGRAAILGETGHWPLALAEAAGVRDELQRRGSIARTVQADLIRARALRALGEPRAASEVARSALELIRHRSLPWLTYHAWRLLGELARDASEMEAALAAFLEAISALEHVQGRILTEYRASFLADKVDVYEPAVDLLLDTGRVDAAFELVERAKSRALVDALAGGLDIRVRAHTPRQTVLAGQLEQLRREHDALVERSEGSPDLLELEGRMGTMLEELHLAGANDLERLSLLESRVYSPQPLLDAETAVLEFYASGEDLIVFVVDRSCVRVQRLPGALPRAASLQRALTLNLDAAAAHSSRRAALETNARAVLGRLHGVLLGSVSDWLARYERLVVVPHGLLHHLPFAALYDGQCYLVERFEIAVAPSASSITFCLKPRGRSGRRALTIGHSAGGALPGATDEAETVAQLLGGERLLEDEVTLGRVKDAAAKADLIHLAAHGVARLDAPLFSFLRLADGHLTALDCFELDLDCSLVTLSACESGRGVVAAGDEQVGLPRALLYAGARAVLHTLWRIDDRVTRAIMDRFYRELEAGRGRAAALRNAQLDCFGSSDRHPFFWAGFVLVGDWR
jgi:tetratricopeptide (TPR) repeat protein